MATASTSKGGKTGMATASTSKGDKTGMADGDKIPRLPRYIPPNGLEGDAAFEDRLANYTPGINFDRYDDVAIEVKGPKAVRVIKSFEELKFRDVVMNNITRLNYTRPTPIQKAGTPQLVVGNDLMACAQTGSGKTAAYLLPIINTLVVNDKFLGIKFQQPTPFAVILAPTRELVIQIFNEARLYAEGTNVKVCLLYGGADVVHQRMQIKEACHILVATPGRCRQFCQQWVLLDECQFFILDEADRMLQLGFMGDVSVITEKMPSKAYRTSGLFSATFPVDIQKAAAYFLKEDYVFVAIGIVGGACTDVVQEFIPLGRADKNGKLIEILRQLDKQKKVLVFCRTKKQTDYVADRLVRQGINATVIHGDRVQSQREKALDEFTKGTKQVLVATAIAARGLDIPRVAVVVNYDLPEEIEEYVHRVGRTGRVGHTGRSISFYDENQDSRLVAPLIGILKGANQEVPEFFRHTGYEGEREEFGAVDYRKFDTSHPKAVEVEEEDWD